MPDPMPSNPTSETDWSGAISSWGYDLYASGRYVIKQLPTNTALGWGTGGAGDLQSFDVFISDEPEQYFTATEQQALQQFVSARGGVFLVSDHQGASRCSGCVEAWKVINDFVVTGAAGAYGVQCDGNDVGQSGLSGTATTASLVSHFNAGPFGAASTLVYHSGSTVSATTGSSAQLIVNSTAGGFMVADETSTGGRLVLMGDSSPADDGTCQCSASIQTGWAEGSDRAFILNATAWLAHDGS